MTMPFGYVSPEQLMKDRADYARKGIARGRSVVVLAYDDGILFVGENLSRALHKISEIYDRIAFAAVGKYNEFENLRIAGVRLADLRGYSYDRRDVTGRGLANAYAQTLGTIFTQESKPYEVEIVVAEVGRDRRRRPDVPPHLRRLGRRRARFRRDGRAGRVDHDRADRALAAPGCRSPTHWPWPSSCSGPTRPAASHAADGQPARGRDARARPARAASSAVSPAPRSPTLLGQEAEPGDAPAAEGTRPDEREVSPPTSLAGGSHEPPGPDPAGSEPGDG